MATSAVVSGRSVNSPAQVLFASLIGTTIEFFDFYIYATAAVLVFPRLFFPASDPATSTSRRTPSHERAARERWAWRDRLGTKDHCRPGYR
jgi:hypothetical protein